jgi:hypothetical protein
MGFSDIVGVTFVATDDGIFTFVLKFGQVRKVDKPVEYYNALPYMSFHTPGTELVIAYLLTYILQLLYLYLVNPFWFLNN